MQGGSGGGGQGCVYACFIMSEAKLKDNSFACSPGQQTDAKDTPWRSYKIQDTNCKMQLDRCKLQAGSSSFKRKRRWEAGGNRQRQLAGGKLQGARGKGQGATGKQ